jgi:hypothetical protein
MAAHSPAEPMALWTYLVSGAFAFTSLLYLVTSGPHWGWACTQFMLAAGFLAIALIIIALLERLAVPAATPVTTTLTRLGVHALCFFAIFLPPHEVVRRGQIAMNNNSTPPSPGG